MYGNYIKQKKVQESPELLCFLDGSVVTSFR